MWGRKARRIAELDGVQELLVKAIRERIRERATTARIVATLTARCDSLAADLKAAQNALLAEAGENGIRSEAIAHVREVIREATEGAPA